MADEVRTCGPIAGGYPPLEFWQPVLPWSALKSSRSCDHSPHLRHHLITGHRFSAPHFWQVNLRIFRIPDPIAKHTTAGNATMR
jgi:hypothetical protein